MLWRRFFGPLIEALIDNFNWRAVFFINIPVWNNRIIFSRQVYQRIGGGTGGRLILTGGASALGAALFTLTLVLDQGQTWGWLSFWSIICYAATIIFGVVFYFIELGETEPIVDLNFLKIGTFVNTLLNNFVVFMALMGAIFLIPIFAETYLSYDATQTGYLFIPLAVALMIAAPLGGRLIGKVKASYVIFASTFTAGIGMFMLSYIDPRSTALDPHNSVVYFGFRARIRNGPTH